MMYEVESAAKQNKKKSNKTIRGSRLETRVAKKSSVREKKKQSLLSKLYLLFIIMSNKAIRHAVQQERCSRLHRKTMHSSVFMHVQFIVLVIKHTFKHYNFKLHVQQVHAQQVTTNNLFI